MLGVSVSRETLTPNAGYVVGILLRPALAKGAGPADSAPVRGARRRRSQGKLR